MFGTFRLVVHKLDNVLQGLVLDRDDAVCVLLQLMHGKHAVVWRCDHVVVLTSKYQFTQNTNK